MGHNDNKTCSRDIQQTHKLETWVKNQRLQESDLIIYQDFTLSKKHAVVKNKQKAGMYKAKYQ